jgi:hypothetical protein
MKLLTASIALTGLVLCANDGANYVNLIGLLMFGTACYCASR